MNQKTIDLMKFMEFTNLFGTVKRDIYKNLTEGKEYENDAEHTYQVVMAVWYICETYKIECNQTKLIKYALVHDLVEAYAGDVSAWDLEKRVGKEAREKEALEQIKNNFGEFSEMTDLIEAYEQRNDKESKIVYATDKILTVVNIMNDQGRFWKDFDRKLDKMIEIKDKKIAVSPEIHEIWADLLGELKTNNNKYFR